jgi:hypothetical protein
VTVIHSAGLRLPLPGRGGAIVWLMNVKLPRLPLMVSRSAACGTGLPPASLPLARISVPVPGMK